MTKTLLRHGWRLLRIAILLGLIAITGIVIWAATLQLPTLDNFEERRALLSTRIYDRTGETVLFDFNQDVRRTPVELDEISDYLKEAAVAIEDDKFYEHYGVRPQSIVRAAVANLQEGGIAQGGSTITQQVVKNALLTRERSYTRKIKEAILAIRLERRMSKDEILELYLNESPYGGTIYGAEEASQSFFNKSASELTLAEAAYLAALPQAPTFYSPYGENVESLELRKDLVLDRMLSLGYIDQDEYDEAIDAEVEFQPRKEQGIRAPHFVFYVRSVLEEELGVDAVENGGLKVITTLDLELQDKAEEIVARYGERNATQYNAENAASVAIDPKSGHILSMVGSRDWFDDSFDGQFNAATALRQPGSTMKPIVYATAFEKGYTPDTVLFDLPTQFNANCPASQYNSANNCYAPQNYDGAYKGPMTIRNALAQSRNIPAVKALYLAGIDDSAQTAQNLGMTSLDDPDRYGLTLVLGGGEVRLVDLVGAYSGFANEGRVFPHTPILEVTDYSGDTLLQYEEDSDRRILDQEVARQITDILSDNVARTPLWGANSLVNIPNTASKSGTTNNNRDSWLVGYNTDIVVGVWGGNNDNEPLVGLSGLVVSPIWNEIINEAKALGYEGETFTKPENDYPNIKPVLRGVWRTGGPSSIHSILAWVDRSDPRGAPPTNPSTDPQYQNWEASVASWVASGQYLGFNNFGQYAGGYDFDPASGVEFSLLGLKSSYNLGETATIQISTTESLNNVAVFVDNNLVTSETGQTSVSFTINESILANSASHTIKVLLTTTDGQIGETSRTFRINGSNNGQAPDEPDPDNEDSDSTDGLLDPIDENQSDDPEIAD